MLLIYCSRCGVNLDALKTLFIFAMSFCFSDWCQRDCTRGTIAAMKTVDGVALSEVKRQIDTHGSWNGMTVTAAKSHEVESFTTSAVYPVPAWQLVCTLPWQTVTGIWCSSESRIMARRRNPADLVWWQSSHPLVRTLPYGQQSCCRRVPQIQV